MFGSTWRRPIRGIAMGSIPRRPGAVAVLIPLLAVGLALYALPGCGGSSDGGEGGRVSSDKLEQAKESAETARDEAQEAGGPELAKSLYEKGIKYYERGNEHEEDSPKKALQSYRSARNSFRDARNLARKNRGRMAELNKLTAEYKKLHEEALKAGVKELRPDLLANAEKSFAESEQHIADGKLSRAKKPIRYAIDDVRNAIEQSQRASKLKARAAEMRTAMIELRDRAVAAKAEELALSDMEWGKNQEREGNAALDDGRFELAYRHFESAKGAFAGAIERAKGAVVTSAIPMPSAGQSYPGGLDGGDSREAAPEVGEIDIPDLGDDSDPDLETGILKLFHVTPEYSNGILRLSYPLGADLKHDLIHVQGSEQDIIFEGADWVGFGQNDYSFAGNTFGYWLVNASFEDGVRVRCKVLFQLTLDLNPYFNVVFMADPKNKKNFYASNYGTNVLVISNGLVKGGKQATDPTHRKHPTKWVQRRDPYELEVLYRKKGEDEKGEIQVFLNGEECARHRTDKYRRGMIGFRWNDVKFVVRDLEIAGPLDDEWAREELKRRLAVEAKKEKEEDFGF